MVKWVLEDDCLAPRARIEITYKGKNPLKVLSGLTERLIANFETSSANIYERDYRWDTSSDPRRFFIRIYARRKWDLRNTMMVEIIFEGLQPSDPSKDGEITIKIGGIMKTEFELDTAFKKLPIYKALLWLYCRLFYADVRRGYLKFCQTRIDKFADELRKTLEIPESK